MQYICHHCLIFIYSLAILQSAVTKRLVTVSLSSPSTALLLQSCCLSISPSLTTHIVQPWLTGLYFDAKSYTLGASLEKLSNCLLCSPLSAISFKTRSATLNASTPAGTPQYTVACSRASLTSNSVRPLLIAPRTCTPSSGQLLIAVKMPRSIFHYID